MQLELSDALKEQGVTLEQLRAHGWTDEELIQHGHAVKIICRDYEAEAPKMFYGQDPIDFPKPVQTIAELLKQTASMVSPAYPINRDEDAECPLCAGSGHAEDAVTSEVTRQLIERDIHGRKKYGVTLDRDDLSASDWLQHMIEELMDGAGYATRLKAKLETMQHQANPKIPTHDQLLAAAPGEYTDWEKRIWVRGFKSCVTDLMRR